MKRDPAFAERDLAALEWLRQSDEPGVRMQVRRDLLGEEVKILAADVLAAPRVVPWERSGPSEMLTLHSLGVLRAAGAA